jgi:hypothetical protein
VEALMDGFDECGLNYLTASSVAAYRDNPAFWVMRYLFGAKPMNSAPLARTIAIKEACRHWLYQGDIGAAEDLVDDVFRMKCADYGLDLDDPDTRSEHSSLLAQFLLTVQGFQQLEVGFEFGQLPIACDLAHSVWVDGLEAPFLSAPAFVFEEMVVELKPGKKCYYSVQERDQMRCAVHARVYPKRMQVVIYATHKRFECCPVLPGSLDLIWAEMAVDALALQTFIKSASSREHALAMLPINPSHFRWDQSMLIAAGKALALTKEKMDGLARTKTDEFRTTGTGDLSWDVLPDH